MARFQFLFKSTAMLMLVIKLVSGALPKASPVETPWEDLKSALSSPNILVPRDYTSWKKQCYDPFIKVAVPAIQMLNQPTGLCMMHASCAFQDCFGPPKYDSSSTTKVQGVGFISTLLGLKKFEEDRFNLPAVVLHPHSVSDIVQAVLFSKEHDIGVTVKVGGHSYYGASTARDTLLIKMSTNYPSYAMEGSLTECANRHGNEYSGVSMACKLAAARGKNAVIRVGGGEIWGKAYRAVSVEWNRNNPNKYHLVGVGSMTVSSAGGWFHSGGLAGPNGMRMFGFGVDQALHIEMVLPSGTHVRFGPSEWQHVDGYIYPKTTKVIGFCNVNPFQQEANWNWSTCAENINFDDLWFAVRGGGGGTYGILTSLYYQLHDYPGELQRVYAEMKSLSLFTWTRNSRLVFTKTFIEFLLRFLYRPLDFNVSQLESNRCGEGFSLGLNPFIPFVNPRISCYGSSAATLINSWRSFVTSPAVIATFRQAGMTNRQIETVPALFVLGEKADSFYDMEALHPTSPNDKALPIPALPSAPEMTDSRMTHFPYSTVVDKTEKLATLLAEEVLFQPLQSRIYTCGGMTLTGHDQTTSMSPTRREAAFLKHVPDEKFRNLYLDLFWDAEDGSPVTGNEFPGMANHNHALIYEMGPLKNDWTVSCPTKWSQSKRRDLCVSQGESFWGTVNLRKLKEIKQVIDPDNRFICTCGVGYESPPTDSTPPSFFGRLLRALADFLLSFF